MSAVTVKFFASLREEMGQAEINVNADSLSEVMATLGQQLGIEKQRLLQQENIKVAVNQALMSGNCPLVDGDEVAFLPPVTGG
jgi:molybdopterin synthase sulfur carrier subunit